MDLSALQDIGLTSAETKVYVALLELGLSKAGPIVQRSGLQNSVVHLTLHKLCEKGLASFVRRGKVKQYQAADPRTIIRFVEEKKQRCEALLPELLAKQNVAEHQEAEVFDGMNGFRAMCYKLIEDAQPGDDYLFFAFITPSGTYETEVMSFYEQFRIDRLRRGLQLKGIAHSGLRSYFIKHKFDLDSIRFVDFPMLQNISVCRDKVIFTPWQDRRVSFLITSRQLAENFRSYFYSVWDSKPDQPTIRPGSDD